MDSEFILAKKLFSKQTPSFLKGDILSTLEALKGERSFDLAHPPLLTKYSEVSLWNEGIKHLKPPIDYEDLHVQLIYEDDTRYLMLGWAKKTVADEEHLDLKESFLILEGSCTFQAEHFSKKYSKGDYIDVPDCHHSVKVTSEIPLKAIIQRLKAA